jgi:hypothetical protein
MHIFQGKELSSPWLPRRSEVSSWRGVAARTDPAPKSRRADLSDAGTLINMPSCQFCYCEKKRMNSLEKSLQKIKGLLTDGRHISPSAQSEVAPVVVLSFDVA